jgi:hypothetical protein
LEEFTNPGEEMARREESARHVLHGYRERRRRRRGEDTYFGSADALLEHCEVGIDAADRERRRSEIIEEGEEAGMPRDLIELMYDVAREEGLDPGLALELVKSGLGVMPPADGVSNEADVPVSDPYLPAWMFPASPPDHMLRERTLHMSFRRVRALLERYHDIDEAFQHFATEPDVGHVGY